MNRFWQCPNCGGILEKKEATLQVINKLNHLDGTAKCSYCNEIQSANDVYGGAFDFTKSDDFIIRMGADRKNLFFDQERMRWVYKGNLITLKSDFETSDYKLTSENNRMKRWWQFWK